MMLSECVADQVFFFALFLLAFFFGLACATGAGGVTGGGGTGGGSALSSCLGFLFALFFAFFLGPPESTLWCRDATVRAPSSSSSARTRIDSLACCAARAD